MRQMIRSERALSQEEAYDLLKSCDFGILATVSQDGQPYGVPVNYALVEDRIIVHCAPDHGHKLDNLRAHPKVSFTVVGQHEIMQEKISTKYESAIVFGTARIVEDAQERCALLEYIVNQLSPDFPEVGMRCIENKGARTGVVEISIEGISGKARRS